MGRLCYLTTAPGRVPVPRASGARKLSRCKPARTERYVRAGRVWRAFCHPGTNFIKHYACRGTSCLGTRNLSRCRIYIAGRCACPGATAITNLSWVQEHLPASRQESKNRDKQLTHIVRVSCCPNLNRLLSH